MLSMPSTSACQVLLSLLYLQDYLPALDQVSHVLQKALVHTRTTGVSTAVLLELVQQHTNLTILTILTITHFMALLDLVGYMARVTDLLQFLCLFQGA